MPTITKKQLEDYEQMCRDRNNGRLLTPVGCVSSAKPITMTWKPSVGISYKHWLV